MTTPAVASEWVKLRSVRSPVYLLVLSALAIVGYGAWSALADLAARGHDPASYTADPLGGSLAGVGPVALLAGALGALVVTREYAARTVLTTFTAVPARHHVVGAKAGVVAGAVLVVALVAVLAAFAVSAVVLGAAGEAIRLTAPGVPGALLGGSLYLAASAAIGSGLGWLFRSAAGALTALFVLFFVVPVAGLLLPRGVSDAVGPFLPTNAGAAAMQIDPSGLLPPWAGVSVLMGYVALTLGLAAWVVRRRDV